MSHSNNTKPERRHYSVDAIVLAGGEARRMGGRDKGLMQWRDKALIAHVLSRIAPQVDRIAISANRSLTRYRELGFEVYQDIRSGFQGPLAGIEACVTFCRADYTLIVSCDMPLLPADLTERLANTLDASAVTATFVDDGERQHYLCALVKTPELATISAYLDGNQRSVRAWLGEIGAKETSFSDNSSAFHNINQPDDIKV